MLVLRPMTVALVALGQLLRLAAAIAQPPMPAGPEFQVNTFTTFTIPGSPAIATDAAGNFVVVWTSYGSAGSDSR